MLILLLSVVVILETERSTFRSISGPFDLKLQLQLNIERFNRDNICGWRTDMLEDRRISVDRRSGRDRRNDYSINYFLKGGIERRSWKERRSPSERRFGWMRGSDWASVFVEDLRLRQD